MRAQHSKRTILVFGTLISMSGCTSVLDTSREAIGDIPDWFEERRDQASDEGFPDITAIPSLDETTFPGQRLMAALDAAPNVNDIFDNDPRARPYLGGQAEIEAQARAIDS